MRPPPPPRRHPITAAVAAITAPIITATPVAISTSECATIDATALSRPLSPDALHGQAHLGTPGKSRSSGGVLRELKNYGRRTTHEEVCILSCCVLLLVVMTGWRTVESLASYWCRLYTPACCAGGASGPSDLTAPRQI